MSAPLVKTSNKGIYKRGGRYCVVYRDPSGKQRRKSARTMAEARVLKAAMTTDVARSEYRTLSSATFEEYAREWIDSYTGRTSRGIRDTTKDEYRRDLGLDEEGNPTGQGGAVAFFERMKLAAIEPRDLKRYAAHLVARGLPCRSCYGRDAKRRECRACGGTGQRPGKVSNGTVRLALAPVKALLATAFEEGLIRSNPGAGVRLAQPSDQEAEEVKALTEDELRGVLEELPESWRLFFDFLGQTGLRISEAVALTWADVDFARRRVQVRRRLYRGKLGPPKSRFGRRDIPLSKGMARALSARWNETRPGPDEPLFPSRVGTLLDPSNVAARVLKPAAKRAGVGWAAFHTFRHTCATRLFRNGMNAKQVQIWLGHHSPAFTLAKYVHLLPDDLPEPTFFDGEPVRSEEESEGVETFEQAVAA